MCGSRCCNEASLKFALSDIIGHIHIYGSNLQRQQMTDDSVLCDASSTLREILKL